MNVMAVKLEKHKKANDKPEHVDAPVFDDWYVYV